MSIRIKIERYVLIIIKSKAEYNLKMRWQAMRFYNYGMIKE